MPVKDWLMCSTIVILFGSVAFLVWGLGRTLQSLFD
jgi:hypothetical protein